MYNKSCKSLKETFSKKIKKVLKSIDNFLEMMYNK